MFQTGGWLMTQAQATRIVLAARPNGKPVLTDFRIEKTVVPKPGGDDLKDSVAYTMREILSKSLTLRGFINFDFVEHYPDFLKEVGDAVRSSKIKYREDIVEGIDNAPQAFIGMLEGRNFGKLIIKVS